MTPAASTRRYGGLTPEERRAERRRRLLGAALELFGTQGYAGVGINRLCSQAGVTARHFYEEFGTFENLLLELYRANNVTIGARILEALAAAPPDLEHTTLAGVEAAIHAYLDDPRVARVNCVEVVGISPAIDEERRRVSDDYQQLLLTFAHRMVEQGEHVNVEPTVFIARALVGAVNESVIAWLEMEEPVPMEDLIDELVQLLLALTRIPPRATWVSARRDPITLERS